MKICAFGLARDYFVAAPTPFQAQDNSPPPCTHYPKAAAVEQPPPSSSNTVMRTNSMSVLDDKKRLGSNDYVSFRVVEDRDNESQHLRVNDNGELEVPYIGLVPAQGRTCKELAYSIKNALEKEYYYHATVILAVDRVSEKSRGRVYVYGCGQGSGSAGNSAGRNLHREQGDYSRRWLWRFCQQTQSETDAQKRTRLSPSI